MKTSRAVRIVFFAILIIMFSFASASAYCVYNHTNKTLRVRGEFSPAIGGGGVLDVKIKPGKHECCPGDSHGCGERWISIEASTYSKDYGECYSKEAYFNDYYFCFGVKVPAHGSASIFSSKHKGADWPRGHVKDKDGKIIWEGLLKGRCGMIE